MGDILTDLSEPALIKAIEDNLLAFHPYFLNWPRSEGGTSQRLMWSITDIPFAMFNNVLGARFQPEEADGEIEAVISRGRVRKVPLLWFTGPSTLPADLGRYLIAHGFVKDEDAPGMAVDLLGLPPCPVISGFSISAVNDTQSMKQWSDTAIAGYGMPDLAGPAFLDWLGHYPLNPRAPLRHYIGWLNGRAVATASLLLASGAAGIYNVATLPEARGKGIGTAMTLEPLLAARAEGYRVGVLQSSVMGFNVYRKLGFKQYCSIGSYFWEVNRQAVNR